METCTCLQYTHTPLRRGLTVQQMRCVHSDAPTLTPEDIPLPRSIHYTLHTNTPANNHPEQNN